MNLEKLWVQDPIAKQPSVSLTLLLSTFILLVTAGGLHLFKLIESTSIFLELFYSVAALYFGRRFSIKGQNYSSEKAQEIVDKLPTTNPS